MPALALAFWFAFFLLAIVARAALQYRRTGSTGLVGLGAAAGSREWFGGVLFAGAIAVAVAAPILDLADTGGIYEDLDTTGVHAAGIVLFALGLAATIASQLAMGASWRVGVDERERTDLVTSGLFSVARNPIYTAMIAAFAGLALLVPGPVSFGSVVLLVIALEMQTRLVEEPHLCRVHGATYLDYSSRVGRFVPGIGLIRR
jgi:protein-S-isoprenylcysteine O-methyltransferase Ste14